MIFWGIHPVIESLRSKLVPDKIHMVSKTNNSAHERIKRMASDRHVPIFFEKDLQKFCGTSEHQGVCAEISGLKSKKFEMCSTLPDALIMLDGIQDPHNFGAALRVCEVFGFTHIIFHKGDSCGLTPAGIKASAGAIFHLNFFCSNLNSAIKRLKAEGFKIMILDAKGEATIDRADLTSKYCLVVGSEFKGVRFAIKRVADQTLRIPILGKIQSLNLSCALSTALYEFSKKSA